jgi:leader peptidase (prepilin peptidase)/N-methyltransferase
LFSKGLGREALGLGDADLMMMAGCFLGWQPVVVAFFVSVAPALFFGLFQWIIRGENELPFGPSLSAGLLITMLGWQWLGPKVQFMCFYPPLLFGLAGGAAIAMLALSYLMRLMGRGPAEEGEKLSG